MRHRKETKELLFFSATVLLLSLSDEMAAALKEFSVSESEIKWKSLFDFYLSSR